ncbi:MAG: secretin N-terminal domain-containing protein [Planctomycetota bacterium]
MLCRHLTFAALILASSACVSQSTPSAVPAATDETSPAAGEGDAMVYRLEHIDASETAQSLEAFLADAVDREGERLVRVQADVETNSLIVHGDDSRIAQVRALLGHLDRAPELDAGADRTP